MQPLGHNRYGPKTGGFAPSGEEELGPDLKHNVARADAYLLAKFHLDPSIRFMFLVSSLFFFVWFPCGRLSWLHVSFWAHVNIVHHIISYNYLATVQQRYRHTDRQTNKTGRQRSDSIGRTVFGRPFVKLFALYYRTVVCPVCLSWPKPHCLRWGPAPPQKKGHSLSGSPQFSAHVYCAKTVARLSYC